MCKLLRPSSIIHKVRRIEKVSPYELWDKICLFGINTGKIIMLADIAQQSSYAIGWGTLALINAGLAQSKNRSGIAWFLLSLLLGPIATFFIVILESVVKK